MNFNNVSQIKFNGSEIELIKLDGIVVYQRIPLYKPREFEDNSTITEVRTMVDKSHTSLWYMFRACTSLTTVNTVDWNTRNVTNMSYMFAGCQALTSIDLNNFDVGQVKQTQYMFSGCVGLTKLNLSSWYTNELLNAEFMFSNCSSLTELDLSNFDMSKIMHTNYMFLNCDSLHILRLDNCSNDTISKIIEVLPTNAIEGVTKKIYCKEENATGLTKPFTWEFEFDEFIVEPEGMHPYEPYEFQGNTILKEVNTIVNESHTSLDLMFSGCTALTTVNTSEWNTSNVTDMRDMFRNCNVLTSLDVSSFDTTNVTDMGYMFSNCKALTKLDVSSFDTNNVTIMNSMFAGCRALTSLDLSNWDTSNVIGMSNMFSVCTELTSLNLSNFDMSNVFSSNANDMLAYCNKLHTLRLDNCSKDTINKIITSEGFPTNAIEGQTRKIYCKQDNAAGLTVPTNWQFVYVD